MIDRYKLVNKNNPILEHKDLTSPFTLGNGDFVFTVDITGLQTFYEVYNKEIPINTMANWGWHSFIEDEYDRRNLKLKEYQKKDRKVYYASDKKNQEGLYNHLRENPHKFNLAKIAFYIKDNKGNRIKLNQIKLIKQELDLWEGILYSHFEVLNKEVKVKTLVTPDSDSIAVSVKSKLIETKNLALELEFPYPSIEKNASNWKAKEEHKTILFKKSNNNYNFIRLIDKENYFINFKSSTTGDFSKIAEHKYLFNTNAASSFSFVINFSKNKNLDSLLTFTEAEKKCKKNWENYWQNGGIIDFSKTDNKRAKKLEKRIILSQYLTAVQCSGTLPPAETGLTANSWYGKFHLEMHFWHAAHFALWNREEMLEKSLWWYYDILARAKKLARDQGYKGARWPKMVGPAGYDSPSHIGPFLIWQQPHPIIYAELLYRINNEQHILEMYYELVEESAQFMESFLEYDSQNDCYNLEAPLIPAQESFNEKETLNPTFELEYWHFALKIAQKWRKRMGLKRNLKWDKIINNLAGLPQKDKVYLAHEKAEDTFNKYNVDHPSMLAAFGVVPGYRVDKKIMENTFNKVIKEWQFDQSWGWDFPVMAMTAARLGKKEKAVDLLLLDSPKNTYLKNGHNKQGNKDDLPLYLPGNGALLLATAMMAAGWGKFEISNSGFPDDWIVRHENINEYF